MGRAPEMGSRVSVTCWCVVVEEVAVDGIGFAGERHF